MLEEILYNTSLIAAEATYEINPCERIEKWWDSVVQVSYKKSESLANSVLQDYSTSVTET